MKKFCLFFTLLSFAIPMIAQELKVKSFDWDMMDISAQTHPVVDKDGKVCALLKVGIAQANVAFEGNIVGTPANKTGEYWVYLADGAEAIAVKTENYGLINYKFPQPLKGRQTYILTIEVPLKKTMDDAKKIVQGANNMEFEKVTNSQDINKIIHVRIESVYPMGASIVDNAIREYINEELGGSYEGNINDGKNMMQHYTLKKMTKEKQEAQERYNDKMAEYRTDENSYRFLDSIYVAFENENLITLRHFVLEYRGGIENFTTSYSVTFRKSDGRQFGYDMMKNMNSPQFRRLFVEALKEFLAKHLDCEVVTDRDLLKYITIGSPENYGPVELDENNFTIVDYDKWTDSQVARAISDIEYPEISQGNDSGEVYVSSEGVTFVYPTYGISSLLEPKDTRAACTIGLKEIRPFVISTIVPSLPNE